MANTNMFLFWGSDSIPCWKVMLVLAEYGLLQGMPNEQVSFATKAPMFEEFIKLNPRRELPAFKDGDVVVNEADALCLYLQDNYDKHNQLMPTDHKDKAAVLQRMFETAHVQSLAIEPIVHYKSTTKANDLDTVYLQEMGQTATEEMKRWNDYLEGKDYLVCEKFTMADVFFFPHLAFMVRDGVEFNKFTNLKRYFDEIAKRPSVKATWPLLWSKTARQKLLNELDC